MKTFAEIIYKFGRWSLACILMVTVVCGSSITSFAADKAEAQSLIDKSKGTVSDLMHNKEFSWLKRYLKNAKGVLIFPQVLKAGFFLGGSGGTGVLLVHNEATGTWSEPAFYTVGSVTFGLQIGAEAAEVVMVATNQKALDSLLSSTVKLGAEASVAIGPLGGGAEGEMSIPAVKADFVSFTKAKGLYAGLDLTGSVLEVRKGLNSAYYAGNTTPKDIIILKDVDNAGANELRSTLKNVVSR